MSEHFFLAIEGLDGSGKSDAAALLTQQLQGQLGAAAVLHSYEPHTPSAAGDYIRAVLTKQITISNRALALAFALNRLDHRERLIDPFLVGGGRVVLLDRYYLSSMVYQARDGMSAEAVWELNSAAPTPDLFVFLNASVAVCYQRMGMRGGERQLFEERLDDARAAYQRAIALLRGMGQRVATIDADGDQASIVAAIRAAMHDAALADNKLDLAEVFSTPA